MNPERWLELMKGLGIGEHQEMFKRVHEAYSERHRHYHTAAHINACLREFAPFRSLARFACEVEAALWFHDVIYAPGASDNESRSADLAVQFLASAGVPSDACARVHSHILATMHNAEPAYPDSALVVDVDRSILGQDPAAFDAFETQVREEYKWVPGSLFRRKRVEVLRSLLERKCIYSTPQFRERYEAPARVNLKRAIDRLEK
jgi:predicted metal-dependent HD superfamily phosphohydrolase